MPNEIAKMECSDCKASYYAEIFEASPGRWEIGKKVDPPKKGVKVRRQNMLCGDCKGKGGPGSRLDDFMRRTGQGRYAGGGGADPFGLF